MTATSSILNELASAHRAFDNDEPGSREALVEHSRALIASLEIPSEFLQRTFWAEPAQSPIIRMAVDVELFQHLQKASDGGLDAESLAQRTGMEVLLLQRLARHLVAMNVLAYHDNTFHATPLSNGLAAENFRHSVSFCHDAARPSFNVFPQFFKENKYQSPTPGGADGPYQAAHSTKLPFFEWLVATPPNLQHFNSFMSAYRAGKPNWYDFYPVAERLIDGFESSASDVLLVDVGGGRGHDMALFGNEFQSRPGRIILQDREPKYWLVARTYPSRHKPMTSLRRSLSGGARAYSLHSILHDWSDKDGVKKLENLTPALKKGYSKVLFNEIVVHEEKPTLAATSMDLMMLAHFGVRERTEADWRAIFDKAGLKVVKIYSYPGVAGSLIETELA
ncbi:O-methyltransferase [Penicillium maclennaniae]|uniref:O-methyltransferase n=1 Tax=Penicillium maclennaniae TaxID=1343394 RepID=UPI002541701E|nr:O-methyltransferase [Penicillium maclennaniae]KAJ5674479.1 O-methyltransferase [Penicillium maclennaniae]